jgi:hypothetical protein
MRLCRLRGALAATHETDRWVLHDPRAWLGIAFHRVMKAIRPGATPADAELVWNTAVAQAAAAASLHPLDSRFSIPERWPSYFLLRQRALASASKIASRARPTSDSRLACSASPETARGPERLFEARDGRLAGRPDHFDGHNLTEYKSALPDPAWPGAAELLDTGRNSYRLTVSGKNGFISVDAARGRPDPVPSGYEPRLNLAASTSHSLPPRLLMLETSWFLAKAAFSTYVRRGTSLSLFLAVAVSYGPTVPSPCSTLLMSPNGSVVKPPDWFGPGISLDPRSSNFPCWRDRRRVRPASRPVRGFEPSVPLTWSAIPLDRGGGSHERDHRGFERCLVLETGRPRPRLRARERSSSLRWRRGGAVEAFRLSPGSVLMPELATSVSLGFAALGDGGAQTKVSAIPSRQHQGPGMRARDARPPPAAY